MMKEVFTSGPITTFTRLYVLLFLGFGIYTICGHRRLLKREWLFVKDMIKSEDMDYGDYDVRLMIDMINQAEFIDNSTHYKISWLLDKALSSNSYKTLDDKFLKEFFIKIRYRSRRGCNFITKLIDLYVSGNLSLKKVCCILLNSYAISVLSTYCRMIYRETDRHRSSVLSMIKNFSKFNIGSEVDLPKAENLNLN